MSSLATFAIAVSAVVGQAAAPESPLRVHPENSRYFTDGSGKVIYLTGSHVWWNLQDSGTSYPPAEFDFERHLDSLRRLGHNFIRLWRWELTKSHLDDREPIRYWEPHPWSRTGPGNALDGRPRFDLRKFNAAYFDRLRARVVAARDRGFYISIMLFQGGRILQTRDPWCWKGHPMHRENNVNHIDGDPNGDGRGIEVLTLDVPDVTSLQEAYVRKVVDTVNDLDNVLYEISNESWKEPGGINCQYHMIRFIQEYQSGLPKQHPVGMTALRNSDKATNAALLESPADWVSPGGYRFFRDPPAATGEKVSILDTDHIFGVGGSPAWVWKAFTRGHNPIYMDPFGKAFLKSAVAREEEIRKAMGHTRSYATRLRLRATKPRGDLSSTGHALADPGSEYLVYQPGGGEFTVELKAGTYHYEWFRCSSGSVADSGKITAAGGKQSFEPPFPGDAVLYLKRTR